MGIFLRRRFSLRARRHLYRVRLSSSHTAYDAFFYATTLSPPRVLHFAFEYAAIPAAYGLGRIKFILHKIGSEKKIIKNQHPISEILLCRVPHFFLACRVQCFPYATVLSFPRTTLPLCENTPLRDGLGKNKLHYDKIGSAKKIIKKGIPFRKYFSAAYRTSSSRRVQCFFYATVLFPLRDDFPYRVRSRKILLYAPKNRSEKRL